MPQFQIFTSEQITSLRHGGKILRDCLDHVSKRVKPGVTTQELDEVAEEFIVGRSAKPGFKGYQNYPATLCVSVNEECVHGLPGEKILKEGDIVSIDCGVLYRNLYTDACVTVGVGEISKAMQHLLEVTERALKNALSVVRTGAHIGDISAIVQQTVEEEGLTPLKPLTGHGLGDTLHQFPDIPNFGKAGRGPLIPNGAVLAIEPIISAGKSNQVRDSGDGWTLITEDRALSAHFEHTILVTEEGCEILA